MNIKDIKILQKDGYFFKLMYFIFINMSNVKILSIIIILISFKSLGTGTTSSNSENIELIDNSDQILILYQRAENYIDDKSYKKSLKVLKSLIKREDLGSHRANIYNLLGFSYRKISKPDLDKSYAAYVMALELDPKHIGAHEYLGELYLMLDQKDKAIDMLNKLEKLVTSSGEEFIELQNEINNFK